MIILLIIKVVFAYSQNNNWVDYSKEYVKISIIEDGIYRITYDELKKTGFKLTNINPNKIQLLFRGIQLPIEVISKNGAIFSDTDYIQFYAKKNDGKLDGELYWPKNSKPHNNFNLFSNVANYFLTIGNEDGKRISVGTKPQNETIDVSNSLHTTKLISYTEDWNFDYYKSTYPILQQSFFEPNELYCGKVLGMHFEFPRNTFSEKITLNNIDINRIKDSLNEYYIEQLFVSRQDKNKEIEYNINGKNEKVVIDGFNNKLVKNSLNELKSDSLILSAFIKKSGNSETIQNDRFSLSYINIKYPIKNDLINNFHYYYESDNSNIIQKVQFFNPSNFNLEEFNLYDVSNLYEIKKFEKYIDNNVLTVYAKSNQLGNDILISSEIKKPKSITLRKFTNLKFDDSNYLIIYNKLLSTSSKAYSEYRQSKEGGNYKVKLIEIEDLYDQYLFGERSPYAIKKYLNENILSTNKPFLLLIGRAFSYPSYVSVNEEIDLVPSIGFPASDFYLTTDESKSNTTGLAKVGRISATTDDEVLSYLDKVKVFESNQKQISNNSGWSKRALNLSGGKSESEIVDFGNFMIELGENLKKSKLGSEYKNFTKKSATATVEDIDLSNEFNKGVGLISFFGHSSATRTDLNFGFATDETNKLNNSPYFPLMVLNGCGAGNVFDKGEVLTKDWLLAKNKGAIAILAHSYLSFSTTNKYYLNKFYSSWLQNGEKMNNNIGTILLSLNEGILKDFPNDIYSIANVHQMVFQGDPAIRVFNLTKPDYKTENNSIFLSSKNIQKSIADNEDLNLSIQLANQGLFEQNTKFGVKIVKQFKNGTSTNENLVFDAIPNSDTLHFNLKKDVSLNTISFIIDYDQKIEEIDETNNTATITFDWNLLKTTNYYSSGVIVDNQNPNLSITLENGSLPTYNFEASPNQSFKVKLTDNFKLSEKQDKLKASLLKICDLCSEIPQPILLTNITGNEYEIIADINLNNLQSGVYELSIQGFDNNKNPSGEIYRLKFKISTENTEKDTLNVYPNPSTIFTQFDFKTAGNFDSYLLEIFDIKGDLIYQDLGEISNGKGNIFWNAKSSQNEQIPNGTYLFKLYYKELNNIKNIKTGRIVLKQ